MCYYDHATHIALRLDKWDLAGQNGAFDGAMAREIHQGKLRQNKSVRKRQPIRFWPRLKNSLLARRKSPAA